MTPRCSPPCHGPAPCGPIPFLCPWSRDWPATGALPYRELLGACRSHPPVQILQKESESERARERARELGLTWPCVWGLHNMCPRTFTDCLASQVPCLVTSPVKVPLPSSSVPSSAARPAARSVATRRSWPLSALFTTEYLRDHTHNQEASQHRATKALRPNNTTALSSCALLL